MEQQHKYMVRVSCMTYNHAPYIEDAMNGFCMQETTFPFVCTIVDDASTDGEQEVIKKYLDEHFDLNDDSVVRNEETDDYCLTFAQHKTNRNCFFAVLFLKYNHYSINKPRGAYYKEWCDTKYIAICEGDDYWIAPNKLQMQVEFMEGNKDYSMCFGDVKYYNADKQFSKGNISVLFRNDNRSIERYNGEQLFYRIMMGKVHIQTMTVLYRNELIDRIVKNEVGFLMGDTPMWLDLSQQGRIKYLDYVYGVYNIHHSSTTHNPEKKLKFSLSMFEMRCYYCEKYGYSIPKQIKKKYNTAYKDIVALSDEIKTAPIYGLFKLNPIQFKFDTLVLNNGFVRSLYKKMFPVIHFKRWFCVKMNILKRALVNWFTYKFVNK